MSELQLSLAAFVIGQSNTKKAPPPPAQPLPALSVRAMRKDSATAPWLQPIEQVRNTWSVMHADLVDATYTTSFFTTYATHHSIQARTLRGTAGLASSPRI
jgi:hypothetical protein